MTNYVMALISNYCIFAYVVILFGERLQSLIRTFKDKKNDALGDGFNIYVNIFATISLVGTLVILLGFNQDFLRAIFKPSVENLEAMDFRMICILIATILFAGMVHTEYTINGIQFASYGILIVALILYTIMNQPRSENIPLLWVSLIYLICLSMAIPVVYKSKIKMHALFHFIEAVLSIALVCVFAYLSYFVFIGEGTDLFMLIPILIAVIGDLIVLIMRWKEEINYFVLIFLIASVVLWIAGKVISIVGV